MARGTDLRSLLASSGAVAAGAKRVFDEERPLSDPLGPAVGSAFPSGHTATWKALVAGVVLLSSTCGRKALIVVLGAVLGLAIGASRVYLGAHYPEDVLAGAALGVACVGALSLIWNRASMRAGRGGSRCRSSPGR